MKQAPTAISDMPHQPDEIVVASGSGHTHGGLLFGLRALGSPVRVTGVCVRRSADQQWPRIRKRVQEIADLLQVPCPVSDDDVQITDAVLAPGYGLMNAPTREALKLAAETEGLILDPAYTAKSMAGLIQRARGDCAGTSMLFVHTGGTPAVFGYIDQLAEG